MERIRKSSSPEQWYYVPSHWNPADLATRSVDAQNLSSSMWHHGPTFLHHQEASVNMNASLASETAEDDPEVRPVIQVLATYYTCQNVELYLSNLSEPAASLVFHDGKLL